MKITMHMLKMSVERLDKIEKAVPEVLEVGTMISPSSNLKL